MSRAIEGLPTVAYEDYIVWLRNPELYDYLREGVIMCCQRVRFALKSYDPAKNTDGGRGAHIVAYAVLKKDAPSYPMAHYWERRYWWVKEYDRFVGSTRWINPRTGRPMTDGYIDTMDSPCEAVDPDSIIAGIDSESYHPGETFLCQ